MKTILNHLVGSFKKFPNDFFILLGYLGLAVSLSVLAGSFKILFLVLSLGLFLLGVLGKRKEENN